MNNITLRISLTHTFKGSFLFSVAVFQVCIYLILLNLIVDASPTHRHPQPHLEPHLEPRSLPLKPHHPDRPWRCNFPGTAKPFRASQVRFREEGEETYHVAGVSSEEERITSSLPDSLQQLHSLIHEIIVDLQNLMTAYVSREFLDG